MTVLCPGATATGMWEVIPGDFDLEEMIPPEVVAESVEFLLAQTRREERYKPLKSGDSGFEESWIYRHNIG